MKNTMSIKKNHEFKRLYHKGDNQASPFLAMYVRKNGSSSNQLGITVGVKLGNAVVRNKVRRRIKEMYRKQEPSLKTGYHIVIVARNRCATSTYAQMERSFFLLCDQLDLSLHPSHPVKMNKGGTTQRPNQKGNTGKQKVNNNRNNTSSNQNKSSKKPTLKESSSHEQ